MCASAIVISPLARGFFCVAESNNDAHGPSTSSKTIDP
jgi:hypothetical protein